ncbi:MAG: hypothetical protein CMH57_08295 [Myxococcales bacterium]|nr:hypothetical protein [Myxococcales bacterium]
MTSLADLKDQRESLLDTFLKHHPHQVAELRRDLQDAPARAWLDAFVDGSLPEGGVARAGYEAATRGLEGLIDLAKEPERARLLAALQARAARLALSQVERHEQRAQERAHLMNVTSHDLRSSMVTIQGYVDMTLQEVLGPLTGEQRSGLRVALRNSRELAERLETLLDFTRLEQRRLKLNVSEVLLSSVLDGVEERFRERAERRGLVFEVDEDGVPEGLSLHMDAERLTRAIGLLVENAIRYTAQGRVRLEARLTDASDAVLIVVRDTGRGIAPEALGRVREPFFRGDPDARTAGVGLTLSDALLQAHGASMSIVSPGRQQGCVVTIRLPLGRA